MKTKQKYYSKSTVSSSANNSRSCTEELKEKFKEKENLSIREWFEILEGIDAISNKVKQLSKKEIEKGKSGNANGRGDRFFGNKGSLSQYSRSSSRRKQENNKVKYFQGSQQMKRMGFFTHKNSQKYMKRLETDSYASTKNIRNNFQNYQDSHSPQNRICQSQCHQVMLQMIQLKKQNQSLQKKNIYLQRKLTEQKTIQKYKKKLQKYNENEIVLRIINQPTPPLPCQPSYPSHQSHLLCPQQQNSRFTSQEISKPISIELKPRYQYGNGNGHYNENYVGNRVIRDSVEKRRKQARFQEQRGQKIYDYKSFLKGKYGDQYGEENYFSDVRNNNKNNQMESREDKNKQIYKEFQNQNQIKISPKKKLKTKILDLSRQRQRQPSQSHKKQIQSSQLIPDDSSNTLQKSKTSEIKTLQNQFDRLMEISHLQRNKAKKRVIWEEMKNIANQLKMMRYFTEC